MDFLVQSFLTPLFVILRKYLRGLTILIFPAVQSHIYREVGAVEPESKPLALLKVVLIIRILERKNPLSFLQ